MSHCSNQTTKQHTQNIRLRRSTTSICRLTDSQRQIQKHHVMSDDVQIPSLKSISQTEDTNSQVRQTGLRECMKRKQVQRYTDNEKSFALANSEKVRTMVGHNSNVQIDGHLSVSDWDTKDTNCGTPSQTQPQVNSWTHSMYSHTSQNQTPRMFMDAMKF